jgi:hypothetical protein
MNVLPAERTEKSGLLTANSKKLEPMGADKGTDTIISVAEITTQSATTNAVEFPKLARHSNPVGIKFKPATVTVLPRYNDTR